MINPVREKTTFKKRGFKSWHQIGSTGLRYGYAMKENSSNLYFGGRTDGAQSHVYVWDAANNTWNSSGSPNAAETSVLALESFSSVLYAGLGSGNGEVWYLTPPSTWTGAGTPGSKSAIQSLKEHNSKLWAGTGNSDGRVYEFVSGTTWTDRGRPGSLTQTRLETDGSNIYAAGYNTNGIWIWSSGTTWNSDGNTGASGFIIPIKYFNGNMYVGMAGSSPGDAKIYKRTGASTWVLNATFSDSSRVYQLWDDGSYLYAGTYNSTCVHRRNGDNDWSKIGCFDNLSFDLTLSSSVFNSLSHCGMGEGAGDGQALRLGI